MHQLPFSEGQLNCVFALEERNRVAQQVIGKWATKHAAMDVAIGLTALVPVPGATTAALIGAILAQAPLIYKPMTRELATVYSCSPDHVTSQIQNEAVLMGAGADLAIEMATEFLKEIASDLIGEAALGLGISAIPFLGALLSAGLDATIAATLTWRVGAMVSAYYQNGGAWLNNRKNTYRLASEAVGPLSPKIDNRTDLNDFAKQNKSLSEKHLGFVTSLVEMMKTAALGRDQIKTALQSKQIPLRLIDVALQRSFGL